MYLKKAFDSFLTDKVNTTPTQVKRIQSAHNSVRSVLENSALKPIIDRTLLQGSYAIKTGVRSARGDKPFDVDVVVGLRLADENGDLPDGLKTLLAIQAILEDSHLYKGKTTVLDSCVRVDYADSGQSFHLDVVPVHVLAGMRDPVQIPRDWRWTNPFGYVDRFNDQSSERCGYLRRVTRLVKYLRDVQQMNGFNSMVLTTRVAELMPTSCESVDDALAKVLRALADWADGVGAFQSPIVCNPSLPTEDLARNWHFADFGAFRTLIKAAADDAEAAIASDSEQDTINLWNGDNLFDGYFPTKLHGLDEAKKVANDYSSGISRVGPTGLIGGSGLVAHRTSGFFGSR